jgi:DNA-binding SARP family transcriptional activator
MNQPRLVELRTLGTLDVRRPDGIALNSVLAQQKRTALLLYLALAKPAGLHRRETLLGLFWAERDDERARQALRQSLYYLRSAIGDELFVTVGESEVGISPTQVWCDAVELDRACNEARWDDALALSRRSAAGICDR